VNRPIRSSQPASAELAEAVRWYEERRNGLGGEFFDAVVATLSLIETTQKSECRSRRTVKRDEPWWRLFRISSFTGFDRPRL
jgi:hypothetical protein